MPRFVAFLRGVSPMNLKMTDLKQCLEVGGFTEVKTILSSGNVAFHATIGDEEALARSIEQQLQRNIGRSFPVTIRSAEHLRKLLNGDPFSNYSFPKGAKPVVTSYGVLPMRNLLYLSGMRALLSMKYRDWRCLPLMFLIRKVRCS